jgi:hypothetical protein
LCISTIVGVITQSKGRKPGILIKSLRSLPDKGKRQAIDGRKAADLEYRDGRAANEERPTGIAGASGDLSYMNEGPVHTPLRLRHCKRPEGERWCRRAVPGDRHACAHAVGRRLKSTLSTTPTPSRSSCPRPSSWREQSATPQTWWGARAC